MICGFNLNFRILYYMDTMRNTALALALMLIFAPARGQNPGNVLSWIKFADAQNSLINHLSVDAYNLIDGFHPKYDKIQDEESLRQYQLKIKNALWQAMGGMPDKSPLNARITGTLKKDGFRLENIIFESMPGFYVTGTLFIPDDVVQPGPAILFCSGHSTEAYRRKSYQMPLLNLVKKGFIVFAIDPIGQGERSQYFDKDKGQSEFEGRSTQEHSYPTVQSFLLGQSVAKYFAWDGIRAIDYLCSRPEVDQDRIGVHGLSGGGTQTAYIAALDDRVKASAPAGYITSYQRLIESIGVQDGEQNLYHGLKNGIDHLDFLLARAPKPTLVMATTNDFFSIQGVYETMEKAQRIYASLGHTDDLKMVEDEYGHGYTRKTREAMYRFFQKHLNHPGNGEEIDVEFLSFRDLQKTKTGQVESDLGGETVYSLIRQTSGKFRGYLDSLRALPAESYKKAVVNAAKHLSGYVPSENQDKAVYRGQLTQSHYTLKMYFLKGEGDYVFPFLEYIPPKPTGTAVIYLNPSGKHQIPQGEIEYFMERGIMVYAPDLPGIGELSGGSLRGDAYIGNVSYNMWYTAVLIGRSIVGVQASDINKLARHIKNSNKVSRLLGIALRQMAPALLHSAVFDDEFDGLLLVQPYSSYESFIDNKFYDPVNVYSVVPGALTRYDLCDLAAVFAPGKLVVAGSVTVNGSVDHMDHFRKSWNKPIQIYEENNAGNALELMEVRYFREDDYSYAFDRLLD